MAAARQAGAEDDDEERGLPPFPKARGEGGKPPFWSKMEFEETDKDPRTRLCDKVFDNQKIDKSLRRRHLAPTSPLCRYAHQWKELKTPPSYARNKPLPAAAPDYVRTFSTTDWGSGHGEAPRFEIAFEDTYPSCATRAVKLFVEDRPGFDAFFRKAGVPPSDLPNSRWSRGISTALCHHFSLQERKCPYWQNCIFLHVETEVLMREFKRYKCMCGPNDGVCRFTRCPYAHTQTQLTIPSAFEEPAFPGEDAVREIRYTSEQTGLESTLKLPRKFIANTSQKIANSLCSHTYDWCSDAQCNHGVHITPEGWAWLRGYSDATKADLPTPRYFASKVDKCFRRLPAEVQAKALPPNRWNGKAWAALEAANNVPGKAKAFGAASAPDSAEYPALGKAKSKPLAAPPPPKAAEYPEQGKAKSRPLAAPPPPKAAAPAATTPPTWPTQTEASFEVSQPTIEQAQQESASVDAAAALEGLPEEENCDSRQEPEELCVEDLMHIPASDLWSSVKPNKRNLTLDEAGIETLTAVWSDGLSSRFNADYKAWLESGQMNASFLRDGNVYFNTSLKIGKGAAAEVFLGIMPSDGREVAVKMFALNEFSDRHFNQERSSMKEHSAIPGILQYINSFEQRVEEADTGREMFRKVVILELMEGSLAEAVSNWKILGCAGKPSHLHAIQFVSASLLHTLSRLNYGAKKDLVHRDVKPDNIMIDHLGYIRLGDFGISKVLEKVQEYSSASSGGPEAFASPEALEDNVRAHRTSDLFSVGMVMLAMMLLRPGGDGIPRGTEALYRTVANQVPSQWPQWQTCAFQALLRALLEPKPRRRAYNELLLSGMTPHRIVMAHPFYWTAQTGLRFLVTLGNYKEAPFANVLLSKVRQAIQEALVNDERTWFDVVMDLEQSGIHATDDRLKGQPFGLLKFIRNKCIHLNSGMPWSLRQKLLNQRIFQERFPSLVTLCWEALLNVIKEINGHMQHAQLREFFDRPVEVESFRK